MLLVFVYEKVEEKEFESFILTSLKISRDYYFKWGVIYEYLC